MKIIFNSQEDWTKKQKQIKDRQEEVLSECIRRMPTFVNYCQELAAENQFLMWRAKLKLYPFLWFWGDEGVFNKFHLIKLNC